MTEKRPMDPGFICCKCQKNIDDTPMALSADDRPACVKCFKAWGWRVFAVDHRRKKK